MATKFELSAEDVAMQTGYNPETVRHFASGRTYSRDRGDGTTYRKKIEPVLEEGRHFVYTRGDGQGSGRSGPVIRFSHRAVTFLRRRRAQVYAD